MERGLPVGMGVTLAVVAAAAALCLYGGMAIAVAGGVALCVWGGRRLERAPLAGLLVIVAMVPLSYLGNQMSFGALNSLTKLVFIPAFAVLAVEWVLTRRPLVAGRQGVFVLLFGLSLGLSYLANEPTAYSAWFLTRFIGMLLLFVLAANAVRTERDIAVLLAVLAGSCAVSAVAAEFVPVLAAPNSYMHGGATARMTGWSTYDAPTFGTDLLVSLLICLYFAIVSRRPWVRLILAVTAGALALAVVRTYARGVSSVMVLSVAFLLFRVRRRVDPLALAAGLVLAGLCLVPLVPAAYWDRMASMFTDYAGDATMTRRMDTYRIGLRLFERSPWLGFGPGNFVVQYTSPEFRFDRSGVPSVCFNLFISVATQTGVAGLAALGATAASAFREARWVRHSYGADDAPLKQYAELLQVVLVALLLMSLFEPTDLQKSLWIVFGAIAAVGHLRRLQGVPSSSPP